MGSRLQKDISMHKLSDPRKILIRKSGNEILILSRFHAGKNVVTRFIEGNENSFFLPADAPLEAWPSGKIFAESWDNMAPWYFERYGFLGANHGSDKAFRVKKLRHWLFERDVGSVMTDDAGKRFVLIRIEDLSTVLVHSDVPAPGEDFCTRLTGSLHLADGRTLVPESVTHATLAADPGKQLAHHFRYNRCELRINGGETLADGVTAECTSARLDWDVDLIPPESLLTHLKAHPGHALHPDDPALPALLHCDFSVTFRPCTRIVECRVTFLQDMPGPIRYGLLQFYTEARFDGHEHLIPGLKPLEADGIPVDFSRVFPYPDPFPVRLHLLTRKDCLDPSRPPDRYIDFFRTGNKRELGVVLGYSPTQGITALREPERRGNTVYMLFSSTKNYPIALDLPRAEKGAQYFLSAYQQYFDPAATGGAESVYAHEESDGFFVWADFSSPIPSWEYAVPESLRKHPVEIVDATPGIRLLSGNEVPDSGILRLETPGPGGVILRIRTRV